MLTAIRSLGILSISSQTFASVMQTFLSEIFQSEGESIPSRCRQLQTISSQQLKELLKNLTFFFPSINTFSKNFSNISFIKMNGWMPSELRRFISILLCRLNDISFSIFSICRKYLSNNTSSTPFVYKNSFNFSVL
jgi:hypothetical protein